MKLGFSCGKAVSAEPPSSRDTKWSVRSCLVPLAVSGTAWELTQERWTGRVLRHSPPASSTASSGARLCFVRSIRSPILRECSSAFLWFFGLYINLAYPSSLSFCQSREKYSIHRSRSVSRSLFVAIADPFCTAPIPVLVRAVPRGADVLGVYVVAFVKLVPFWLPS